MIIRLSVWRECVCDDDDDGPEAVVDRNLEVCRYQRRSVSVCANNGGDNLRPTHADTDVIIGDNN